MLMLIYKINIRKQVWDRRDPEAKSKVPDLGIKSTLAQDCPWLESTREWTMDMLQSTLVNSGIGSHIPCFQLISASRVLYMTYVKGHSHIIFCFRFFHESSPPKPLKNIRVIFYYLITHNHLTALIIEQNRLYPSVNLHPFKKLEKQYIPYETIHTRQSPCVEGKIYDLWTCRCEVLYARWDKGGRRPFSSSLALTQSCGPWNLPSIPIYRGSSCTLNYL